MLDNALTGSVITDCWLLNVGEAGDAWWTETLFCCIPIDPVDWFSILRPLLDPLPNTPDEPIPKVLGPWEWGRTFCGEVVITVTPPDVIFVEGIPHLKHRKINHSF